MRLIAPILPVKVHRGVARIVRRRSLSVLLLLKTLRPRPCFQQRPIHREVLVRSQALGPCPRHHLRQELLRHLGLQQPISVLGERGRVPHFFVHVQSHKPTKQQAVIDLLHQQSFAANRVQHLQQLRPQQLLRRYRRPASARVHAVESSRQLGKHFVHHGPDRPQRMIFPYPRLRRQITEHLTLLMIYASHASLITRVACGRGVVFQQPANTTVLVKGSAKKTTRELSEQNACNGLSKRSNGPRVMPLHAYGANPEGGTGAAATGKST